MPRRDKTGPNYQGPGTGRRLGPCYNPDSQEELPLPLGRGFGRRYFPQRNTIPTEDISESPLETEAEKEADTPTGTGTFFGRGLGLGPGGGGGAFRRGWGGRGRGRGRGRW
jgi:hypothetical protein